MAWWGFKISRLLFVCSFLCCWTSPDEGSCVCIHLNRPKIKISIAFLFLKEIYNSHLTKMWNPRYLVISIINNISDLGFNRNLQYIIINLIFCYPYQLFSCYNILWKLLSLFIIKIISKRFKRKMGALLSYFTFHPT